MARLVRGGEGTWADSDRAAASIGRQGLPGKRVTAAGLGVASAKMCFLAGPAGGAGEARLRADAGVSGWPRGGTRVTVECEGDRWHAQRGSARGEY